MPSLHQKCIYLIIQIKPTIHMIINLNLQLQISVPEHPIKKALKIKYSKLEIKSMMLFHWLMMIKDKVKMNFKVSFKVKEEYQIYSNKEQTQILHYLIYIYHQLKVSIVDMLVQQDKEAKAHTEETIHLMLDMEIQGQTIILNLANILWVQLVQLAIQEADIIDKKDQVIMDQAVVKMRPIQECSTIFRIYQ